jgi:RINT-1/TIP-1 family
MLVQREFSLHLLPLLTRKLRHTLPRILHHPSLLAHTIYQSLVFDASLRDQGFSLEGTTAATGPAESNEGDSKRFAWEGISMQILGTKEWFEAWLEGERKCEPLSCFKLWHVNTSSKLPRSSIMISSARRMHGKWLMMQTM